MLYEPVLRLPSLAWNLTQDGSSGQGNGPKRRKLLPYRWRRVRSDWERAASSRTLPATVALTSMATK